MEKDNWREKAEEYLNGWKRAQADLINYKKDEVKRFEDIVNFASQSVIAELLPVLDSLDQAALNQNDNDNDNGLSAVKSQFDNILKNLGLEKIDVKIGDRFDPAIHEAVESVASDKPPGLVAEELAAGYKLNGRVIRPIKVKVSN